ncbi:hypothetical protein EMCRGX_G029209 [Ephydatia muelleri]
MGCGVLNFLIFGSCLIALLASAAEQGDDCGVYGWEIPASPPDATLLQVHVLTRHGDRVPASSRSCWPNDSEWTCTLGNAEIPMYSDTQYGMFLPRVYRKVYQFGESLPGNCSAGQLTTIGFNQQIQNGASLRKAYVDTGFLPANFDGDEIYLRSDGKYADWVNSAEALILGMFPPNGSQTEVLHINTLDESVEYITPNPMLCPKFEEYLREFFDSPIWLSHYKAVTYPLLSEVSNATNITLDGWMKGQNGMNVESSASNMDPK